MITKKYTETYESEDEEKGNNYSHGHDMGKAVEEDEK